MDWRLIARPMAKMVMCLPRQGSARSTEAGRNIMPMVTVSISPQQAAGIRTAVDTGRYASSSEVVREALRLWDAAHKRSEVCDVTRAANAPDEGARSGSRCVADMFADHEAERRRQA
jgi:antitoxin ParD1/3/4